MIYIVVICIVAAMTGCLRVSSGEKPEMYTRAGAITELLLHPGEELRIGCYANGSKLRFSFPESTILTRRSEHEIQTSENGTYTFLRRSSILSNTGWYACAQEGVEIDDDFRNLNHSDKDVTWIYVYVTEWWMPTVFANVDANRWSKTLIAVAGTTVVVPCRPTSPTVGIELWQNNARVYRDGDAVRFDPKIGFIMQRVDFINGESHLQCKMGSEEYDDYVFLYAADPKPTMFTAHGEDVTLQEGDELRIECSNETQLSFLFPKLATNTSSHKILPNENGTSTFLRSSVVSDDTGWYGCAGMDIENDYIPDYSINYTRKEIAWIYVYVNSSVPMVLGLVDAYHFNLYLGFRTIILCKPTSPESHDIYLNLQLNGDSWIRRRDTPFDPKIGFLVSQNVNDHAVYQCVMDKPVHYVPRNITEVNPGKILAQYWEPVITDTDDPSVTDRNSIIKMTGDDLRLRCEMNASVNTTPHFRGWRIPSGIPKTKSKYNWNRADSHVVKDNILFRRRIFSMEILNVTESVSGEYTCLDEKIHGKAFSRVVEVFDEDGGRYVKLGENGGAIQVAGLMKKTVKWLVDLTDFPSANITWIDPDGGVISTSGASDAGARRVRTAWTRGAPQRLFEIRGLTVGDRGVHRLLTDFGNTTAVINVTVNVQERPSISLKKLRPEQISSGPFGAQSNSSIFECEAVGSPDLNVTVSFLTCPKFPSQENSRWRNFDDTNSTIFITSHEYKDPTSSGTRIIKKFRMLDESGIIICQACNKFGCDNATAEHRHSVSDVPYFTSTNLNNSDVVLDLKTVKKESLQLECFVSGRPYPRVTWFRNGEPIKEDNQYALEYDNFELSIRYFLETDAGQYKCRAENANGSIEKYINFTTQGTSEPVNVLSSGVIASIVLLIVVVASCAVNYKLLVQMYRERKFNSAFRKGAPNRFDPELPVVDQAHLLPYHLKWEYPRELLKLDKILGSGAFGIVKKAEAKSICRGEAVTTVAVKLVRSTASLNFIMALQRELKILAYLGKHPNVVNLLGACTRNVIYGELFVIVEYCRFGNLRDYLLNGRADFIDQRQDVLDTSGVPGFGPDLSETEDSGINSTVDGGNGVPATVDSGRSEDDTESGGTSDECTEEEDTGDAPGWASKYRADNPDVDSEPISTRDLVYWSWQVSRAMDFLGKRKIVHGDLAARNILLSDNNIVKVCDFGLAKALCEEAEYRDSGSNPLPYRWMAIESIKDRVFSYQSDIWSSGVVMWEFFTLAETPYFGIRHRDLLQKLMDGYRMEQPKYAATSIYDMIRQCWEADPADRPSFAELGHNLGDLLEHGFKTEYFEMHAEYREMNAKISETERRNYLAFSLEPPSPPKMDEQIEMEIITRDRSSNLV